MGALQRELRVPSSRRDAGLAGAVGVDATCPRKTQILSGPLKWSRQWAEASGAPVDAMTKRRCPEPAVAPPYPTPGAAGRRAKAALAS
eukprot:8775267-Pyramimonas_sp.AAC.1